MATKSKVSEWDSVASNNILINGININENCPPSTVNNAIREVMAQVKDWQSGTSGDDYTINGTLTVNGATEINGSFSLAGNKGTAGQVLVSTGTSATPTWGYAFVRGMIMLWVGAASSIPSGWRLCDGGAGTPDLRNKFVVGAGNTYGVGSTGGSPHAVAVHHNHTGRTNSAGAHSHALKLSGLKAAEPRRAAKITAGNDGFQSAGADGAYISTEGAHSHSISIDASGVSGNNKNLPPYYALAYIMKL